MFFVLHLFVVRQFLVLPNLIEIDWLLANSRRLKLAICASSDENAVLSQAFEEHRINLKVHFQVCAHKKKPSGILGASYSVTSMTVN